MRTETTRREFLRNAALLSSSGAVPLFLARASAQESLPAAKDAPILVVVQLTGGNDGLNTLAPFEDDAYYNARPSLALPKDQVIPLGDGVGLHGAMRPLAEVFDAGKLAIVQGVGYPNPDRSHFRSMEIWHTASDADVYLNTGWLGRYFDSLDGAPPHVGAAIMNERPQAFDGAAGRGVAALRPERFTWNAGGAGDSAERMAALNAGAAGHDALAYVRQVTANALDSSASIQEAAELGGAKGGPNTPLRTVAGLIRGGLGARTYYVSYGSFDTHAGQRGVHQQLLTRVAEGLASFQKALEDDGLGDRVVTLVFSEFGRRVKENASQGTDHGTAGPVFVMGSQVAGGLCGAAPSLTDLHAGDLKYAVDFRRIYAAMVADWLGGDAQQVVGDFESLPVLA